MTERKHDGNGGTDTLDPVRDTKTVNKKPSLWKVLIHNDDYTPIELVIAILSRVFALDAQKAMDVALTAHKKGAAVCGIYTHEVAETKQMEAMAIARRAQHALMLSVERDG